MQFPTTHWSALAIATSHGNEQARSALEELCRNYWGPVHAFIRSRGVSEAEAQDRTQEFMSHVVEKSLFVRADRLRGRFRSFLLGALVRFLRDANQQRQALKRGGHIPHMSLDAEVTESDLAPHLTASDKVTEFDREWALTILERALASIRSEYARDHREEQYSVLKAFLPTGADFPPYDQAAARLGISVAAFKSEVHRLRVRLRELVRKEVAQTVSAPHELASEMTHLQTVLMDKGSQFGPAAATFPD